ncbi:hypothetical protein [Comamonas sediminis]|uniref:Uncharacterized protein n=1 Tax=Comamonas sediminis TaxID=1783360 RepID=A0ABV4B460_9BURK
MKFESFEDVEKFAAYIEREKDCLLGLVKAQQLVISALVQTHHNHHNFQLYLSRLRDAAELGQIDMQATGVDGDVYRRAIDMYASLNQVNPSIDPLAQLRTKGDN